jgi:DNA-binding XRE family transcriptional regulator
MEAYKTYSTLQNKLRMHRRALGFSQELVAKIIGVRHKTVISSWERGTNLPSLINTFKLAGVYHVQVENLFFDMMDKIRKDVTAKAAVVLEQQRIHPGELSTEVNQR